MRNILVLISSIIGLGISPLQAQLTDKLVPHMGFMWEFATLEETPGGPTSTLSSFYNFHIGTYYAIAHYNDIFSFGVDPSIQVGLNFVPVSNGSAIYTRVNYVIQAPVYLMARVGANSTPYNQQAIGFATGIGASYTFLSQQTGDISLRRKTRNGYTNPSVVAELTILSRGNPLTGRFHFSPFKVNSDLVFKNVDTKEVVSSFTFPMGNWGIGLIYGF
ncbi:MAG: hypothetical protein SF052_27585 [Bacteroidia bacterium]|nr:hypothetical protein [Bacteroidia bacterium]